MRVKVEIAATLKELVGHGELDVECEKDTTIAKLQDMLVERFGEKIIGKTTEYQWLHRADDIVIALNNEVVDIERIDQIRLQHGDIVSLLPVLTGG